MGVCAASGRIGAMVAKFVNGFLIESPVRLLLTSSISLELGALAPQLLPRNRDLTGQPVPDFATKIEATNIVNRHCSEMEQLIF
jgi:hypothetical protein